MPEIVYGYSQKSNKTFEKLVDDDHVVINHIVMPKGDGLPDHITNSNVYLLITKGELTVKFENKDVRAYSAGQLVHIPFRVQMNMSNNADLPAEFFVLKTPNPRYIQEKL
ncbi:MAG: cupin domain-containing protein [Clostridia bacterium]|nr:cupin domain-containing protein [Clostridia bacterium]